MWLYILLYIYMLLYMSVYENDVDDWMYAC